MSDHFSGPRALAGPAADITDFYAFPSPGSPGALCLVLNVHPLATPGTFFSDAISFNLRLRPVTATTPEAGYFELGDEPSEIAFSVTFDLPQSDRQVGRVVPSRGAASPFHGGPPPVQFPAVEVEVNDENGGVGDGVRVFAGLRSDPFFIDLPAFQQSLQRGELAFTDKGANSIPGADVLSIVIEIDTAFWLSEAPGSLVAAAGETVVAAGIPVRLERVGRPEIKNVMLQWRQFDRVNSNVELRDLYNLEDPFHMGRDYFDAYRSRLDANLAALDRLDGKVDWEPEADGKHPLTELLLADYLVVDVAKPYREDSFLEIESAIGAGVPHQSSGGRSLNDDVMDTLYTLLIGGRQGARISDGVTQATVRASETFPYLAPANGGR
ncbi:DUF4331 family protein [Nocardioides sp. NPDC127503]|uniref:DUF4331 family protein n=1 Tax=Nocardioides sp. NPDC127503 TaxID=3154516 RepID=UPI00331F4E7D